MFVFAQADDRVARFSLDRAAQRASISLVATAGEADVVLVEVGSESDLATLASLRTENARALLVVHTMLQNRALLQAAEREGADRIESSGALTVFLRRLAEQFQAGSSVERMVQLCSVADVAGRLGIIAVVEHELGELVVVKGTGMPVCLVGPCPHAQYSLRSAPIDEGILTCPGHGSQFVAATGERIRGPADCGLRTLRVIEESGKYWALPAPDA